MNKKDLVEYIKRTTGRIEVFEDQLAEGIDVATLLLLVYKAGLRNEAFPVVEIMSKVTPEESTPEQFQELIAKIAMLRSKDIDTKEYSQQLVEQIDEGMKNFYHLNKQHD